MMTLTTVILVMPLGILGVLIWNEDTLRTVEGNPEKDGIIPKEKIILDPF